MEEKKKFYQKGWFTILFIIIFWPIGLIVMWTNEIFNKTTRIIITVFFALCIITAFNNKYISDTLSKQNTTESLEVTTKSVIDYHEPITETVHSTSANNYYTDNSSSVTTSVTIVYIGKTGTKYHKENCSTLRGNGKAIPLDDALAQGRSACKLCKP